MIIPRPSLGYSWTKWIRKGEYMGYQLGCIECQNLCVSVGVNGWLWFHLTGKTGIILLNWVMSPHSPHGRRNMKITLVAFGFGKREGLTGGWVTNTNICFNFLTTGGKWYLSEYINQLWAPLLCQSFHLWLFWLY